MNWTQFINDVLAMARTDEFKCFLLGGGLAAVVRMVRAGISWVKRATSD